MLRYAVDMWREHLRGYLFPAADERNPAFRFEIEASSSRGLELIGVVQVAAALFMYGVRFLVGVDGGTLPLRSKQTALIVFLGVVNIVASKARRVSRWTRGFAVASALVGCAVLIWASLAAAAQSTSPNDFIPGEVTLVLLVTVTIMPLRPVHTLILGLGILAEYIFFARLAENSMFEGLGPDQNY